ncbi:MAG: FHA domain-containing protein, partial [Gammaproteobacteria bacterium]|nr:FHA domain-containing protein [Gammaproteobacteria bacterium]
LERRRELAEHVATDLQRQAEARGAELAGLAAELAAREERAQGQERELTQRAARIAQLEEQAGALTNMLAQREDELRDAQQSAAGLRISVARLQDEINEGTERLRALEAQAAARAAGDTQQQGELQALRAQAAGFTAALQEARRTSESASAQASAHQAALAEQRERALQLEASLQAERHRAQQLEAELATVRGEMEEWGGVLRSAQQERNAHLASIAAAEARVRALEQDANARAENAGTLQAQCTAHLTRIRELENDLHATEEALHRLEADTRSRGSRIAELEKSNQQWRETAGEARTAVTDAHAALGDSARHAHEDMLPAEPVPDGATRLLIHSDDGREVVHVLGRKTSIGRTPDNDLQLDAKFISRHHAVILVGPVNTVIEDLNSTNGVQVNGRRITRQTLRDGDHITIGRAQYRFAVRKAADKR